MPVSMIVAQAAYETNWGSSRFAREANNYFGQHCKVNGCGIIPKKRAHGATFEVKKFDSLSAAITSYIHNLNTNKSYKRLRKIRAKLRKDNNLSGSNLAIGLSGYSQQKTYVQAIQSIIKKYELRQYD